MLNQIKIKNCLIKNLKCLVLKYFVFLLKYFKVCKMTQSENFEVIMNSTYQLYFPTEV